MHTSTAYHQYSQKKFVLNPFFSTRNLYQNQRKNETNKFVCIFTTLFNLKKTQ